MTQSSAVFVLAAAPLALVGAGLFAHTAPGLRPRKVLDAARFVTMGVLLLAVASAVVVFAGGTIASPLVGFGDFGISVRLDEVTAVMFVLVGFVGAIVVQYSRNYLDGDPRQGLFMGRMCFTLAAVVTLMIAGNLPLFVASWVAMSLTLHRLLTFYHDRHKAVLAARKKFIFARIGDVCLIGAAILLIGAFGTVDIGAIISASASAETVPGSVQGAAWLLVAAALLKSAQFPFQGWLPEVMETPTPVSALLHAGIINAGGFLVIRFADVMVHAPAALGVLAIVGGFTALFGAVVMLTQNSIKVALAWSTVSQMGFLLLQCGLGLFALGMLHIVAHSAYKAHAFLSSGSVVELAKAAWLPDKAAPRFATVMLALAGSLVLYVGIGWVFGLLDGEAVEGLALGSTLVMALMLLFAQGAAGKPRAYVVTRTLFAGVGVALAYFVLHTAAKAVFRNVLPHQQAVTGIDAVVIVLVVVSFGAVTLLQIAQPKLAAAPWFRAARIHIARGLYTDAVFNRLIGGMKRPAGPETGEVIR